MELLKRQRASVKATITRIQTFLGSVENPSRVIVATRIKALENSWSEYKRIHSEILTIGDDNDTELQENDFEQVENKYFDLDAQLNQLANNFNTLATPVNRTNNNTDVKLPRIELPTFSGNYLEWSSFRDLFKSIIHNNQAIGASQKLHYLKSSLSGEASGLLQSIEITEANYTEAWDLLHDRYQNERQLIQCHLKALLGYPSLMDESPIGIRKLLDNTVKHVRALNALKVETQNWDHILVFTVSEKLDSETRRQWELSSPGKDYPKFNDFKAYLEQRCRALEASVTKTKAKTIGHSAMSSNTKSMSTSSYYAASNGYVDNCNICKREHPTHKCLELLNLGERERTAEVRKHSLCFNCLRKDHSAKQCRSTAKCHRCGSKHHTILHFSKPLQQPQIGRNSETATTITNHFSGQSGVDQVLLSTAMVKVKDYTGNHQQCRAILDSGSQASFITEACMQRLGLKRSKANVSIVGIGQTGSGMSRGVVTLQVESHTSTFCTDVTAFIMHKLTGYTPHKYIETQHWSHLANIKLADVTFGKPGEVDIILGADIFGELLMEGKISGHGKLPSAFNTRFGWVLSGRVSSDNKQGILVNFANIEIQEQLKRFWELEEIIPRNRFTPEEEACEFHFTHSHSRDSTGRYQVSLPFKEDCEPLGHSKDMVIKRLLQVENRLNHKPLYKEKYHNFLQQYLDLGHMEVIPVEECGETIGNTNYLPHHFVLKEDSTTTSLRVVFDASAKTSNGISLNHRLMVGPKLQDDIWDILLRFRMHRYAFTADIAKMYRQIKLNPIDADLQRIVWRWSPTEPIQEFRLTTVAFGTSSAPYLATKVLQTVAEEGGEEFPLAKEVALQDFYVDDLMSGADSISEGLAIQSQMIAMLDQGGFQLRKWSSNEPQLLESLPDEYRETKLPLKIGSDDTIKALGLHWHPANDYLFFEVHLGPEVGDLSKRSILSDVARLYDPLGWLSPVIIIAKCLIQKLWAAGVSWDEKIPHNLECEWIKFRGQLTGLQSLKIPRCVIGKENSSHQLHGFSDASKIAYGAVIYLRSVDKTGTVVVHLLCAKTKVAPLKQVSIPRLELCGAVVLARLIDKVKLVLPLTLDSIHAWTDSTVTLSWIAGLPRTWKTFVANRVSEIQELVPPNNWKHVRTDDNPADAASRGLLPSELIGNSQWWNGPSWLLLQPEEWPRLCSNRDDSNALLEQESVKTLIATVATNWNLCSQYSSLTKMTRVTAYCLRFVSNCKLRKENRTVGVLNTKELQNALLVSIRAVQNDTWGEKFSNLQTGKNKSSHIQSLNPFLDKDGIIRVGGRLRNAKCSYDQRFPILLPKKHKLTEVIVKDIHKRLLHAGPQATLATLQQRF